jgi:hypothetical protein
VNQCSLTPFIGFIGQTCGPNNLPGPDYQPRLVYRSPLHKVLLALFVKRIPVINTELNCTVFRTEQEGRDEHSKNYEVGAAFYPPNLPPEQSLGLHCATPSPQHRVSNDACILFIGFLDICARKRRDKNFELVMIWR